MLKIKKAGSVMNLTWNEIDLVSNQEHVLGLSLLGERIDVPLSHDELSGQFAFLCLKLVFNHLKGFTLSLSLDHLLLLVSFSLEDLFLSPSLSEVDIGLLGTFRSKDLGSLASLSFGLKGHAGENLDRGLDVSYFITEKLDSPFCSLVLDILNNLHIDIITLLERLIKRKLTDLTTHGRLRKVNDGLAVVLDVVARLVGIHDLDVNDSIDLNEHIIFSHTSLRRDFNDLFSQIMHVLDLVDDGDLEVKTRLKLGGKLLEAMKHNGVLLANDDSEAEVIAATCSSCG